MKRALFALALTATAGILVYVATLAQPQHVTRAASNRQTLSSVMAAIDSMEAR